MHKVFIVGCGDIGRRVARLWLERKAPVSALARRPESAAQLRENGIDPVAGDLDDATSLRGLPLQDCLLYYFAPPPSEGITDPRMRSLLDVLETDHQFPAKIVYISTTGVYGNCDGGWVDETSATQPQTDRGRRRLDAENALRGWGRHHAVSVVILRVSGIYGPGRLPIKALETRRPVLDETQSGYTNRIHSEDLANICVVAAERGRTDGIYNVSDGQPGTLAGYYNSVADVLGLARPPVINRAEAEQVLGDAMLSYLRESRRIDSSRLRDELGVELKYPTLEAGLAASLDPPLRQRDAS